MPWLSWQIEGRSVPQTDQSYVDKAIGPHLSLLVVEAKHSAASYFKSGHLRVISGYMQDHKIDFFVTNGAFVDDNGCTASTISWSSISTFWKVLVGKLMQITVHRSYDNRNPGSGHLRLTTWAENDDFMGFSTLKVTVSSNPCFLFQLPPKVMWKTRYWDVHGT